MSYSPLASCNTPFLATPKASHSHLVCPSHECWEVTELESLHKVDAWLSPKPRKMIVGCSQVRSSSLVRASGPQHYQINQFRQILCPRSLTFDPIRSSSASQKFADSSGCQTFAKSYSHQHEAQILEICRAHRFPHLTKPWWISVFQRSWW